MKGRIVGALSVCALLAGALSGCGLSGRQREDITRWEVEAAQLGHPEVKYTEHVTSGKAAGLGFLPFGIGGFYVRRPGLGVTGILFWPLSVTWTVPVAAASADQYNYSEFRKKMIALRQENQALAPPQAYSPPASADEMAATLDRLERLRAAGKVSEAEYQEIRRRVLDGMGSR
jgi:hypothetical protein